MPEYDVVRKSVVYCDPVRVEADSVDDAVRKVADENMATQLDLDTTDEFPPEEWPVYPVGVPNPDPQYAKKSELSYVVVWTKGGIIQGFFTETNLEDAKARIREKIKVEGFDPGEDDVRIFEVQECMTSADLDDEIPLVDELDQWIEEYWEINVREEEDEEE